MSFRAGEWHVERSLAEIVMNFGFVGIAKSHPRNTGENAPKLNLTNAVEIDATGGQTS